jgi:hypothetical protein
MAKQEATFTIESKALSSTRDFRSIIQGILFGSKTDAPYSEGDWDRILGLTKTKLKRFQSVTMVNNGGKLEFKHGDSKKLSDDPVDALEAAFSVFESDLAASQVRQAEIVEQYKEEQPSYPRATLK